MTTKTTKKRNVKATPKKKAVKKAVVKKDDITKTVVKKEVTISEKKLINDSFTLGVLSLLFLQIPVVGLVLSIIGKNKLKLVKIESDLFEASTTLNKIGFIIGLIVTIFSAVILLFYLFLFFIVFALIAL